MMPAVSGNVNVGTFLNVQGSGSFAGNVIVSGFVQASNFSAAGSNTGLAGNVTIGSNLTAGGTITGTALVITGSYASVAGNVQVGSLLTVGSLITSTALNVTGPYASIAGNTSIGSVLTVGSAASFLNNISVAGTILASNFVTLGSLASLLSNVLVSSNLTVLGSISGSSLNISGPFASITGNASIGSSLVVSSQISATALNITGPFASISGSVNIGSNVVIAGSLMATVLNIGGSYSSLAGGISVGGLITNNVFGNLHLKVYDESAVYNNVGAGSVGGALPAMFTSKPTLTMHANTINLTNQTFGTLTGKYSTRFAGYVQPPSTGTYSFRVTYRDGATLWIGVEKIINSWQYQSGIASSVTSLTMYANIWSPFSLEHTCATSAERLLVEWNLNGGSYSTLQHAASNFQFAYELGDLPCTQLSTTYVSGQLFAGDSIVAEAGIVLPNSSVFTGATSQLYNDAGFVTYLGATNSASAASLTHLTVSTITASSLSATLAYTSTLTVGTILNFSAGGTLGTNLTLSGSINAVSGSISTLTIGTILNFSAGGGTLGTNLILSGTLNAVAGSISTLSVGSFTSTFSSVTQAYSATLTAASLTGTFASFAQSTAGSLTSAFASLTQILAGTLTLTAGALGSLAGDQLLISNIAGRVSNSLQLQSLVRRIAAGTSWNTSTLRLQTIVDVSTMSYQDFNASGNAGAIAWGSGNVEGARLLNGNFSIMGSLTVTNSSSPAMYLNSSGVNTRLNIDSNNANQSGVSFQSAGTETAVLYRPANSTDMRLFVNSSIPRDLMTWTNTNPGRVGILSTSPAFTLDVSGSARVTGSLTASSMTTTAGGYSLIAGGATSTNFTAVGAAADTTGQFIMFMNGSARTADGGTLTGTIRNDAGGDLRFITANSASGLFVKGATGFYGINTAAPASTLDVNGSACISGSLSVSGVVAPKIQSGIMFISNTTYFTFPTAFTGVPIVSLTYFSAPSSANYTANTPPGNAYLIQAGVFNVSASGFSAQIIYIANGSATISNTGSAYFTWIAVGA